MNEERQSNFELMRIISIFSIILWHVIIHGGVFNGLGQPASFISNALLALLIVHVNSLVFVTGYFNSGRSKVRFQKIAKLLGTAWFYKAVIIIALSYFGLACFSKITIMEELMPLDLSNYWFINCYVVIYLLSPYLNKVTERMSEKEFIKFILLLLLLLSFIPIITMGRTISNNGYNILNFVLLYYIGSFCRKYPPKENYHFKSLSKNKWRILLLISFFLLSFSNISLYYLGEKMQNINSGFFAYYGNILTSAFLSYANPIVILQTCCYCLFFESMNFKSRMINFVAKASFGIYLIHDNYYLKGHIYKWLNLSRSTRALGAIIILFESAFIIFIACFLIENIRRILAKGISKFFQKSKNLIKRLSNR